MSNKHQRLAALLSISAVAAFGVSACGSDDNSSSSSSTGSAAAAPAASTITVPEAVKSKGTLTVAADASYAPNEFIGSDGKTVEGADVELAKAIGKALGLKVDVRNAGFDSIIPGLAAKKFDLGMSSFTDTKEREQTVDFVTYFSAGTSFYTKAQGGTDVTGLADLCGKKVAVEKGTTQASDAAAQSKKCGSKGAVHVATFPDQNGANLAIQSGRAQIGMADSPVAAYQVKQSNNQFKLVGTPYGTAPYGIAIPKGNGMAQPVLDAVKQIMSDGQYKQILTKWGIQDGAISDPVINGATA
jgi:polar amino acid transport system substrate-binding protein